MCSGPLPEPAPVGLEHTGGMGRWRREGETEKIGEEEKNGGKEIEKRKK